MKCAILRPSANGTQVIKFEDPVTCNAAELSGDTVIYYGYDYDLAAETITNTAGVKRKFLGDAKFTTTNVGGTFGGIPTGTTINDLTAVAVDCAIASVPIAFPADLVKASDGKVYKKNSTGTAWITSGEETNTYNVNNTMTAAQIQAIIDAATAGKVVKFAPGTYALGASALILKDGVHMDCGIEGSVTFTSSNATGTLHDNNVAAVLTLSGFPVITNTGGLAKRIVLQNASSKTNGFYWEYIASLTFSTSPSLTVLRNSTGDTFAFTRTGTGEFLLQGANTYSDAKCVKYFNTSWSSTPVSSIVLCSLVHGLYGNYTKMVLSLFDTANTAVDYGTLQFVLIVRP